MKKIIIISTNYLSHLDFKRLDIDNYLKNKINIEVWYLNELVKRNYKSKKIKYKRVKVIKIQKFTNLEKKIKENHLNCLYDLRLSYTFANRKIFYLLSKYKIHYLVHPGTPINPYAKDRNFINFLMSQFKKIINGKFFNLIEVFFNKIFLLFNSAFWGIQKAEYAYLIGKFAYLNLKKNRLIGPHTNLIWGHHRTYDDYLKFKIRRKKNKKKNILFIDQAAPHHPDLIELNLSDIDEKKYYNSIKKFLVKLKKDFGYDIEISAHPRFSANRLKKFFPKFKIKIGKTIQQIKEANLIVCHASNAINFAVIFNKPVMFVTNDCLSNSVFPHNQEINYMAEQFGKNTINIDSNTIANIESYLKIDKKAYKNYLTNFIKFKGKKKIQSDIIVDQLKKNKFWQ
mgnify:CR=1 FL=1